jgi:glycosyltransferase involved in cell wall biosynthesis
VSIRDVPVSVVIPTKNEEQNLPDCLSRLSRFREIVIVDSNSTDATCEIAKGAGARVIHFVWDGRFPKKRNWVLINHPLECDWVLFLDADELVNDGFCDELVLRLEKETHFGYWINYKNRFLRGPLRHGDPQRKLALFRVGSGLYERIPENNWSHLDMEIHEHPVLAGSVGTIQSSVDHHDDRGLARYIERHLEYAKWEACRTVAIRASGPNGLQLLTDRQRQKYRNIDKLWFAPAYALFTLFPRLGILDGRRGIAQAFYKLWYFSTIRLLIKEAEVDAVPSVSGRPKPTR